MKSYSTIITLRAQGRAQASLLHVVTKQMNYVFYVRERTAIHTWDRIGVSVTPIMDQVSEDVDER